MKSKSRKGQVQNSKSFYFLLLDFKSIIAKINKKVSTLNFLNYAARNLSRLI